MGTKKLRIGRKPDNDIVIDDPSVSGYHATATLQSTAEWLLEDNDSTNGTFIDNVRVRRAVVTTTTQVLIGKVSFDVLKLFRANKAPDDFTLEFQELWPVWEEIEKIRDRISKNQKNVDIVQALPYVGKLIAVAFEDQFEVVSQREKLKVVLRKWVCPKCQQPLRDYDWFSWDDCRRLKNCPRCKVKWF
ncbi:FHA domain-containing protein [Runella sp.]|uniref:FHA domain-containing protein n=1 Tax=Runella sp. TaxID=1960881 RepID=UPI003D0CA918